VPRPPHSAVAPRRHLAHSSSAAATIPASTIRGAAGAMLNTAGAPPPRSARPQGGRRCCKRQRRHSWRQRRRGCHEQRRQQQQQPSSGGPATPPSSRPSRLRCQPAGPLRSATRRGAGPWRWGLTMQPRCPTAARCGCRCSAGRRHGRTSAGRQHLSSSKQVLQAPWCSTTWATWRGRWAGGPRRCGTTAWQQTTRSWGPSLVPTTHWRRLRRGRTMLRSRRRAPC
jgi:hypothetical protein